jgi:hypothetical protein
MYMIMCTLYFYYYFFVFFFYYNKLVCYIVQKFFFLSLKVKCQICDVIYILLCLNIILFLL